MKTFSIAILAAGVIATTLSAHAQTMIEGVYLSPSGDNGRGACTLEIRSMGKSPKYGDELYALISSGEGACEWTAVGLAKNFGITAGMVSSGGHSGYINAKWPFGPGGGRVEVASFEADGAALTRITFVKADSK